MTLEEIKEVVSKSWVKGPRDNMCIATGKGGFLTYKGEY